MSALVVDTPPSGSKKVGMSALVAAVVVAALLGGVGGYAIGHSGSDSASVEPAASTTVVATDPSSQTTAQPGADTTAANSESDTTAAPPTTGTSNELASIEQPGFVTYDALGELWASAGAWVVNNSDHPLFYVEVSFNFVAADGTPVDTSTDYIEVIPAGGKFPASATATSDMTANPPTTIEVHAFARDDSVFSTEFVEMTVGGVVFNPDQYYSTLSGTVTNPSQQSLGSPSVACIVSAADGTTLTGVRSYTDRVAPGQTIAWQTGGSEVDAALANGATTADCRSIATVS